MRVLTLLLVIALGVQFTQAVTVAGFFKNLITKVTNAVNSIPIKLGVCPKTTLPANFKFTSISGKSFYLNYASTSANAFLSGRDCA